MDDFEVTVALRADGAHVLVRGELDLATAPDLEAMLDAALGRRRRAFLDLADLRFIDATGAGVLGRVARRVGDRDALVVVRARPMARRVLELTGVDGLLRLSDASTTSTTPATDGRSGTAAGAVSRPG